MPVLCAFNVLKVNMSQKSVLIKFLVKGINITFVSFYFLPNLFCLVLFFTKSILYYRAINAQIKKISLN